MLPASALFYRYEIMLNTIVALGNPGPRYEQTRHNYGWLVADEIIDRCSMGKRATSPAFELYGGRFKGRELLLCKPLTFMNRSGLAIDGLMRKQQLEIDEMLVLYDDIDIDFGRIKLRSGGGDGGHKGIRSIINETGRADFYRLRLGIKPETRPADTPEFVLAPFSDEELPVLKEAIPAAAQAAIDCMFSEPRLVMNSVNRLDFSTQE